MSNLQLIRNIGILAHVDAGKTTLTEQILLHTGAIRKAGRVDQGTAHTDSLPVERQRGISVRSDTVCVRYSGHSIHLIDTPGHVDFSAEVENALAVVDGVVLVISAVEGVQPQTAVILRVLASLSIPALVFINKMDRPGADRERVLAELSGLAPCPVRVDDVADTQIDLLSAVDDTLLEKALEGEIAPSDIQGALARACRARLATPVTCGSALRGEGVEDVLNAVIGFLPPPEPVEDLSVVAYHVQRVGEERRVHVRVFGGELKKGNANQELKIRWLRRLTEEGLEPVDSLCAGEMGVLIGAEGLKSGDWLGERSRGRARMTHPVMRARIEPEDEADLPALHAALSRMQDEQPELAVTFEPRTRQLHVQVLGEIQQEIIGQTLSDLHGVKARLLPPEVMYQETPIGIGEGVLDEFYAPWEAYARFEVRPLPRGSGVRFVSIVPTTLKRRYQRSIEEAVYAALREGLYGWPVTDIQVTLTEGRSTPFDWPGSRFAPVVPLGLFAALAAAGTCYIEPILSFEARVDTQAAQALLYQLGLARAEYAAPEYAGDTVIVTGKVPAETTLRFASVVQGLSRGRGIWRTEFSGYEPAPAGCGRPIARTTPDPLNRDTFLMSVK